MSKFKKYYSPKSNHTYERHQFNTRNQNEGESIDSYVTELRILSNSCEFGDLTDSLIKYRLVCGVLKDSVRSRLLQETELTLQKAIDICRAAKTLTQQMIVIQSTSSGATGSNENVVKKKIVKSNSVKNTDNKPAGSTIKLKSRKCGYKHEPHKCPAFGKLCHNCKRKNHFSTVCKNKKIH